MHDFEKYLLTVWFAFVMDNCFQGFSDPCSFRKSDPFCFDCPAILFLIFFK